MCSGEACDQGVCKCGISCKCGDDCQCPGCKGVCKCSRAGMQIHLKTSFQVVSGVEEAGLSFTCMVAHLEDLFSCDEVWFSTK